MGTGLYRTIGENEMKILVINGSPKGSNSNTYRLTSAFLDGMREGLKETDPQIEVKELAVNSLTVKPCLGCFSCWNRTPGQCCISDDMSHMIQTLLWADVIIWSFPLYYFTVPGPLKNLIDRQLPMLLPFMAENETGTTGNGSHPQRYRRDHQKTVVISTCGFYTAQGNYDGVYSLFDHTCGRGNYTAIFCGQGELFRVPEVSGRTDEYLSYVRQAGQEYIAGGISQKTQTALNQLLFPKETFEAWADASWGIHPDTSEKESDALIFTRQMAALYRKENYPGKDLVLEMYYTDVGECYQILLSKDGSQVYTDGSLPATTRIETPVTLWRSIAAGKIRGDEALMKHLYKVTGDFQFMLHWDTYFGSPTPRTAKSSHAGGEEKTTNMCILLLPWMALWTVVPISRYWGSFACIGICALLPLLFYRNRKTPYEILTNPLVTGISLALAAGAQERQMLPFSYLVFGSMWTVSCFFKIPLTANYSMNHYGGEDAYSNPLFIKTNRILTLLWGLFYISASAVTYLLMGTSLRGLTGIFQCTLPIFLGIFTAWFQKWYPAKVAGGA